MRAFAAALSLILCATAASAQGATSIVREAEAPTGTNLRQIVGQSSLYPLTKTWAEFTAQEKSRLRQFYVDMAESDEPPFPLHGMAEITREISHRASSAGYHGELRLHVTVDALGNAKSVDFIKYVDLERAKPIARVLVNSKFKPGVCAGRPCEMQFPFYAAIVLR